MESCNYINEKPFSTLALTCPGRAVSVIRCLLFELSSVESGGGLSVVMSEEVTITGTSIISCSSQQAAGGSYLSSTGNATISLSCYFNTTSTTFGVADKEDIKPSTITQDLNAFFQTPNTGNGKYVIYPVGCSTSTHKHINVSHCKLNEALICLSTFSGAHYDLDFSSFAFNKADSPLYFNSNSQSSSHLNIVSNEQTTASSHLFKADSSSINIFLKNSVFISNSYIKLASNLQITFHSCVFYNCSFTTGTNERPTTIDFDGVYFESDNEKCHQISPKTITFSIEKKKTFHGLIHIIIPSD